MNEEEALAKATPPQEKSYRILCERHGKKPLRLWYDSYGALMCEFKLITIGIEKDGYAHS